MASAPPQSSYMELWRESGISKPEPLRIIKGRSKTVAGSNSCSKSPDARRRSFGSADASGSPPEEPHKFLTIQKKRRYRGSILDGSFGQSSDGSSISALTNQAPTYHSEFNIHEDPSTTALRLSSRAASVGSFIKSELFRSASESENNTTHQVSTRKQSRGIRDSQKTPDQNLFLHLTQVVNDENSIPRCTETPSKSSKGRKIVSRAFDSFGSARSKSMHFLRSKPSKESLLRHMSLRSHKASRVPSSNIPSVNSSRFSFEPETLRVKDLSTKGNALVNKTHLALAPSFILYPKITVIPEVNSVDAHDDDSIWVAVVITGILRKVVDHAANAAVLLQSGGSYTSLNEKPSDDTNYGYLYGVDIKLAARSGCTLETVIIERNDIRLLRPGQIEIILVRIKLKAVLNHASHTRESSAELIAELESCLGNKVTSYLGVRLSYQHSAFPTYTGSGADSWGMSYYATSMRTETHAVIRRHVSHSAWDTLNDEESASSSNDNPLIPLINAHCDPIRARDLIRKISMTPASFESGQQKRHRSDQTCDSLSTTVVQSRNVSASSTVLKGQAEVVLPVVSMKDSLEITQAGEHQEDSDIIALGPESATKFDPARKIWSEMRQNSRGMGYYSSESPGSRTLSSESGVETSDIESDIEAIMQQEKARIMELVIRNKRSMGADTLRSIATPSSSMAFGRARGWGWAPPWW